MALTSCPECGGEVSDTADQCPNCGYDLGSSWFRYEGTGCSGCLSKLIVGFVLLVLISSFFGNINDQSTLNTSGQDDVTSDSEPPNESVCDQIKRVGSIKGIQDLLKGEGQDISIDGDWGPNTREALRNVCGKELATKLAIQVRQTTTVYGSRSWDFKYREQGSLNFKNVRRIEKDYNQFIVGIVKNTGEEKWDYLQVNFKLYDSNGNAIGSAYANYGSSLYPGETWKFEAMITDDNVAAWQFDSASGW